MARTTVNKVERKGREGGEVEKDHPAYGEWHTRRGRGQIKSLIGARHQESFPRRINRRPLALPRGSYLTAALCLVSGRRSRVSAVKKGEPTAKERGKKAKMQREGERERKREKEIRSCCKEASELRVLRGPSEVREGEEEREGERGGRHTLRTLPHLLFGHPSRKITPPHRPTHMPSNSTHHSSTLPRTSHHSTVVPPPPPPPLLPQFTPSPPLPVPPPLRRQRTGRRERDEWDESTEMGKAEKRSPERG
ncbi:hypothetical protein J437_LFUL003365 [Ladona fulva]|uniref:Uncharacterized protein n=1 Tax=Ladona fulva TaxID=123851 RepID=A0A8K0JU70_LADFU|nr:hypothetical protein J437_LFUL003365 [Ladona fulva]